MAIDETGTEAKAAVDFRIFYLLAAGCAVIGILADLYLVPGQLLGVIGALVDVALAVIIALAAVRAKRNGKPAALIGAACGAAYGFVSGLATFLLPGLVAAEERVLASQPPSGSNPAAQQRAIAMITSPSGRLIELVLLVIGSALLAMIWAGLVSLFVKRPDATQV